MADKQTTAVEWYIQQIEKTEQEDGYIDVDKAFWIQEQALAMQRNQTIKAYEAGQEDEYQYHINAVPRTDPETYYNETYGKE
jgi:hypothetical protein